MAISPRPSVATRRLGREGEPLVIVDGFAPDPDGLRAAAQAAAFQPAGEHYPGVRAPLPPAYLAGQMPTIARLIGRHIARCRRVRVIDASFSIVSSAAATLSLKQRLPHVDAFGTERIAMVHYLSPEHGDGTAFYRHRATGFETIGADRAATFYKQLEDELALAPPPPAYLTGDTPLFERIEAVEACYNRALLYRSYGLHSGAIAPDAALSADPARGRLTVTGFFAVE